MSKLTKEQTSLFTVIAAAVMLIAFFAFKMIYATPWVVLTKGRHVDFLEYVFLILFLLVPIYLGLFAYRNTKALEPLKPIFTVPAKLVYACPLALWSVFILYTFISTGAAFVWIFMLAAAAVYYIGQNSDE